MHDKKIVIIFFALVLLTLTAYVVSQTHMIRTKKKQAAPLPNAFASLSNPASTNAVAQSSVQELAQVKNTGTTTSPSATQQSAWLSQYAYGTGVPSL